MKITERDYYRISCPKCNKDMEKKKDSYVCKGCKLVLTLSQISEEEKIEILTDFKE